MISTRIPRVSIGLPVYNGGRFLKHALDTILSQTFEDFELIISDNASDDDSDAICRAYADRDARIQYSRHQVNLGAAENYNRVFRLSRAPYFKWASHDDALAPEFLERCVSTLDNDTSVVLCYPQTMLIDEDGKHLERYADRFDFSSKEPHKRFEAWALDSGGRLCNAIAGVIRSDVLARTGLIGDYKSADVILLAELLLSGKFAALDDTLFFRRDHPDRSMRSHHTDESIATWYNPANKGKHPLPAWRWFFEYLKAIGRSRVRYSERLKCYMLMIRWFYDRRLQLRSELSAATRRSWNRQVA